MSRKCLNQRLRILNVSPSLWLEQVKQTFTSFLIFRLPEEHLKAIQDYLNTQLVLDSDFVKTGSSNLPHLKKLTSLLCKELHG